MAGALFELRHVSKKYDGRPALADVSFTIEAGRHTVIIGPSGCGKSTALRLLAGLETPCEGQVLLDGNVISKTNRIIVPPHLRGVAMVFQDLALWPNLSVIGNVLLGLSGAGLNRREARKRAREALAVSGIESLASRLPGKLSGGQQQRVALARAIAQRPDFLFLDEPFSGLDLITKARLLEEISSLSEKHDFTIVLVSHDPQEVSTLCLRAVVLHQGRVEESGDLTNLLEDPKSEILVIFQRQLRRGATKHGSGLKN